MFETNRCMVKIKIGVNEVGIMHMMSKYMQDFQILEKI